MRLDGNADDREDGPNGKARGERQCAHAQNLIGPLAGYLLHLKALSKNAVRARAPPRVRPFCMAVFSAAQPVYPSGRGLCFHAQAPCKKKPLADPHMNVKACQRRCWMSGPFIRPRWTVGSRSVPVYQQGMCQASARCFPPCVVSMRSLLRGIKDSIATQSAETAGGLRFSCAVRRSYLTPRPLQHRSTDKNNLRDRGTGKRHEGLLAAHFRSAFPLCVQSAVFPSFSLNAVRKIPWP